MQPLPSRAWQRPYVVVITVHRGIRRAERQPSHLLGVRWVMHNDRVRLWLSIMVLGPTVVTVKAPTDSNMSQALQTEVSKSDCGHAGFLHNR